MIAFFLTVLIMMATIGGLFTFFEICILRLFFKIENFKYVKLLKKLEIAVFLFAFIMLTSLKIPTILLSLIYSLILIYDFYKKKITKKDFIIYFLYFFIDITLIYLIMILILRNFPTV